MVKARLKDVSVGLTLSILLATVAASEASQAEDGYAGGYRGPDRTGIYPATGLLKEWPEDGPKVLWDYQKLADGWSSIAVRDGKAYVVGGTSPGRIYCFDVESGKLLYSKGYGPDRQEGRFAGPRSTVEFANGKAYLATGDGIIHCLDPEAGKVVWSVDTVEKFDNKVPGHGYNITPLIHDGKIICPIRRGKHTHVALDLETGETVWASAPSEYAIGDSSPVLLTAGEQDLIIDNLWHALVAVDPDTGEIVWTCEKGRTGTMMTPVPCESGVFADLGGHRAAFFVPTDDPNQPLKEAWRLDRGLSDISQAMILDGKVFYLAPMVEQAEKTVEKDGETETKTVRNRTMGLHARDIETGEVLQSEPVRHSGSMSAADGMLYVLTGGEDNWTGKTGPDTHIRLVRPTEDGFEIVSDFKPLPSRKEAWINPAIADGRLFYRQGNRLSVYDLRPGSYKD